VKANQVSKSHAVLALILLIASIAVAGCSHSSAPMSLDEQRKDILNPPPVPPDVLAKYRGMYSQGGAQDQKIQQSIGAAGAAKQAADAQARSQPPGPATH